MNSLVIFLVFFNIFMIDGANILLLSEIASPSHFMWNLALVKGLAANKDYNITIVSPDTEKNLPSNMHLIHLEETYESMYKSSDEPLDLLDFSVDSPWNTPILLYKFSLSNCEGVLKSKGLDVILNYPDDFKFDIVLHDFLCGDCLLPLLHKFKYPPLVAISALDTPIIGDYYIGGHRYPGYIPHFGASYDSIMSFWERLNNFMLYQFDHFYRKFYFLPKFEKMVRDKYKKEISDLLDLHELRQKTVLMLLNGDYATGYPKPSEPNLILVGGLQVEPKPLTEDLKSFIEKGKKGTVLMSLGTNMRSDQLSKETLTSFLTAFKDIPDYNFVWKFETDTLPMKLPKNVMISKFLPQSGILAHENVKAFITHCGWMSTQEAFWYGKPMIGIPFFGDQHRNIQRSIRRGVAVKIDYRLITANKFKETILKVLNDHKYTTNAKLISNHFQDQPEKPLTRAIWWIEYILRYPNPQHLQSPTKELGFLISNSYDVIIFIVVVLGILLKLIFKLVSILLRSRKTVTENKKKN